MIILGVVVVGLGDLKQEQKQGENVNAENPILGDIFTVIAMLFYAGQLTYEEKFVKKHNIQPLHCLGLEGSFSLAILSLMLVVLYFIPVKIDMDQPGGQLEDALDGFVQLGNNPVLLASFLCTSVALCFTLLAGIGVTRKLSAVHRLVLDSGRSVFIWAVSLIARWQIFQPLQIIGFLIMSVGVLIFNDILIGKKLTKIVIHINLRAGPVTRSVLRRCGLADCLGLSPSGEETVEKKETTQMKGKYNEAFVDRYTAVNVD